MQDHASPCRGDDDHDQDCDSNWTWTVEHDDHNIHDDDDKDGVEADGQSKHCCTFLSSFALGDLHKLWSSQCTNRQMHKQAHKLWTQMYSSACEEMKASMSQKNIGK